MPHDTDRATDREIVRLAVPAFLTLVAEPMFLLVDAAVVGHLGTTALAGLGIAGAVLQTLVGLCVFLAYGTTASVARRLGAGDLRGALAQGIDGVWLAVLIGILATAVGAVLARPLVTALGARGEVADQATTYLSIASFGAVPLLVMLAATGILRGIQDTRTPLWVAVAGNALNAVLNVLLVHGVSGWAGLGIAGSAIGSVVAQVLSALALTVVVVRAARREGASLRPDLPGLHAAGRAGVPLLMRTLTLRVGLLITTYAVSHGVVATRGGQELAVQVATHQLASTVWTFLVFVLDAVAIAAQALTGKALGAGDLDTARTLTDRMIRWGWLSGIATGVLLAALSPFLGALFTDDQAVRSLLVPVLLVAAAGQPLAGVVFVLDGVLIGAGDGVYLAWAGSIVLVVLAPTVLMVGLLYAGPGAGVVAVWVMISAVFLGSRYVLLARRARGTGWMVTGA